MRAIAIALLFGLFALGQSPRPVAGRIRIEKSTSDGVVRVTTDSDGGRVQRVGHQARRHARSPLEHQRGDCRRVRRGRRRAGEPVHGPVLRAEEGGTPTVGCGEIRVEDLRRRERRDRSGVSPVVGRRPLRGAEACRSVSQVGRLRSPSRARDGGVDARPNRGTEVRQQSRSDEMHSVSALRQFLSQL